MRLISEAVTLCLWFPERQARPRYPGFRSICRGLSFGLHVLQSRAASSVVVSSEIVLTFRRLFLCNPAVLICLNSIRQLSEGWLSPGLPAWSPYSGLLASLAMSLELRKFSFCLECAVYGNPRARGFAAIRVSSGTMLMGGSPRLRGYQLGVDSVGRYGWPIPAPCGVAVSAMRWWIFATGRSPPGG